MPSLFEHVGRYAYSLEVTFEVISAKLSGSSLNKYGAELNFCVFKYKFNMKMGCKYNNVYTNIIYIIIYIIYYIIYTSII